MHTHTHTHTRHAWNAKERSVASSRMMPSDADVMGAIGSMLEPNWRWNGPAPTRSTGMPAHTSLIQSSGVGPERYDLTTIFGSNRI